MSPDKDIPSEIVASFGSGNFIHKQGIVLACFIGETRNHVVCVVEGETKSWKIEGQTGLVFETLEEGEKPNAESISRAIREELDMVSEEVVDLFIDKGEFFLVVEEEKNRIVFQARVFLVQLKEGTRISNILGSSVELRSRGMREVSSLNGDTRPGTLLALQLAIGSPNISSVPPVVFVRNGEEVQPNS